jgi:DNA-binding transcriptional ArsR family regulator
MSALLINALNHPLRRKILRGLHGAGEARSPAQLSKVVGRDVSSVSYHMKVLTDMGAVKKTGDRPARGARETFFASKVAEHSQMIAILADTEEDDEEGS